MTIKERLEWYLKYPAIDGIAKEAEYKGEDNCLSREPEKAIRSDIEGILKMDDSKFRIWYNERRIATENMLKQYEIIGSIPALCYGSEERKFDLNSNYNISGPIRILKEGLDYLEKISQVRGEYKE